MYFTITAARELRQRALDRQRVDITHQAADVLALAREGGTAAQAVDFEQGFEQRFGQVQVQLQLAQLRRPHPGQADAQLLQRFGLALARRAAGALDPLVVASIAASTAARGAMPGSPGRRRPARGRCSFIQGVPQAGQGRGGALLQSAAK